MFSDALFCVFCIPRRKKKISEVALLCVQSPQPNLIWQIFDNPGSDSSQHISKCDIQFTAEISIQFIGLERPGHHVLRWTVL